MLGLLGLIFGAIWLLHLPLLNLPYYWDEAGYFVPAAHDIYASGQFIPFSTLSNAHPPLVMTYLAAAWELFGFHHVVTRTAMLFVAAVALSGLFRLAERVANVRVAIATVLCTALYPVFFAQSSLAHLDMMVAALTLWALVWYLPTTGSSAGVAPPPVDDPTRRRVGCIARLALAALTKETAVLFPVCLCGWEILRRVAGRYPPAARVLGGLPAGGVFRSFALLLAVVPLATWFAYHHARTGYTFGNPEYVRYNVGATLDSARIHGAFVRRFAQVTRHMDLWVLTLAGVLALVLAAVRRPPPDRPAIALPVAALFVMLIGAHVCALSLVGGAVLARYLLPVLPLLVLLWVAAIWRCGALWIPAVALVCAAFSWRCEVNPYTTFTWEDNLAYRDFILLHEDAAHFLARHEPRARVLTSWPATNELTNPLLGYVNRPLRILPVEDFRRATLARVLGDHPAFDAALVYSTQQGLDYDQLTQLFGGRTIYSERRNGQWIAVLSGRNPEGASGPNP